MTTDFKREIDIKLETVKPNDKDDDLCLMIEQLDNKEDYLAKKCIWLINFATFCKNQFDAITWLYNNGYLRSQDKLLSSSFGCISSNCEEVLSWCCERNIMPTQLDLEEAVRNGRRFEMKRLMDMGLSIDDVPSVVFGSSIHDSLLEDLIKFGKGYLLTTETLVCAALKKNRNSVQLLLGRGIQWPEYLEKELSNEYRYRCNHYDSDY